MSIETLAVYIEDRLDARDVAEVEAHLEECERCEMVVENVRAVIDEIDRRKQARKEAGR